MSFPIILILTLAIVGFYFGMRWVSRSPHFNYEPAAQTLGITIVAVACILGAGILLAIFNPSSKDDEEEPVQEASASTTEKRSTKLQELTRDYQKRFDRLTDETRRIEQDVSRAESSTQSAGEETLMQLHASAQNLASEVSGITPESPRYGELQSKASMLATTNSELRYKLDRVEADRTKLQRRIDTAVDEARELAAELPEARRLTIRLTELKQRSDKMSEDARKASDKRRAVDNTITNIMRTLENNAPTSTAPRSPFS
ncbi:MAG TPA: hypothetical protein VF618_19820 [Thermoanaerobaculia bacterium]